MTRRLLLSLLFAAAAVGLVGLDANPTLAQAQPAAPKGSDPTDESFESADGVKLNGRFYKAAKAGNGSCVLILPGYKKDPTKGDWGGLANRLSAEGYNVLILHYRGHGKSTDINGKEFFGQPILGPINTAMVKGATKNPPKNSLTMAELKPAYMPMLVNDVMAARTFLERKNDTGEVNVATMYLIGAGDAAPLGLLYTAAEWNREMQVPNLPPGLLPQAVTARRPLAAGPGPVGKDIAAAVWLSADKAPQNTMSETMLKGLINDIAPGIREETRMLFLYGDKDEGGKTKAKYYLDEVLVAKGSGKTSKMLYTEGRPIKDCKLAGVDLLGKDDKFATETTIVTYLNTVEKDRKGKARFERKYTNPLPVVLGSFGINIGQ